MSTLPDDSLRSDGLMGLGIADLDNESIWDGLRRVTTTPLHETSLVC